MFDLVLDTVNCSTFFNKGEPTIVCTVSNSPLDAILVFGSVPMIFVVWLTVFRARRLPLFNPDVRWLLSKRLADKSSLELRDFGFMSNGYAPLWLLSKIGAAGLAAASLAVVSALVVLSYLFFAGEQTVYWMTATATAVLIVALSTAVTYLIYRSLVDLHLRPPTPAEQKWVDEWENAMRHRD